jgi:hypothetical protein
MFLTHASQIIFLSVDVCWCVKVQCYFTGWNVTPYFVSAFRVFPARVNAQFFRWNERRLFSITCWRTVLWSRRFSHTTIGDMAVIVSLTWGQIVIIIIITCTKCKRKHVISSCYEAIHKSVYTNRLTLKSIVVVIKTTCCNIITFRVLSTF